MTVVDTYLSRNAEFAADRFDDGLLMLPATKTIVIGCVDPRVDPADVFGVQAGEAAIIRNVGGRVTPTVLHELRMLGEVSKKAGGLMGPGWSVIVLHHTQCGIVRLADDAPLLQTFFETEAVDDKHVTDPKASVAVDIAALRADSGLHPELIVAGLVYDVITGRVEVGIPAAPLRAPQAAPERSSR